MNALAHLLTETTPPWARIMALDEACLRVEVAPPKLSGAPGDRFDLLIDTDAPEATVFEAVVGTRLPSTCPERHINYDGSFCLGLRRSAIISREQAETFWQTLRGYLLAQQFAERHGRWPPGRGLSHGYEAADCQIAAEQAAARCGLASDYAAALDHQAGWLAGPLPKVYPADSCNHALAPEPDDSNKLGLMQGCMTCDAIAELFQHEWARRAADGAFVRMARMARPCCGTMPNCPLRAEPQAIGGVSK